MELRICSAFSGQGGVLGPKHTFGAGLTEILDFMGKFVPRTYFQGRICAPNFPGGADLSPNPSRAGLEKNRQCTCTGFTA